MYFYPAYTVNYSFGKKEKNKRKKERNKIVKINEREFKKFSVKKKSRLSGESI